jgi:chromosome segregation ATPase
MRRIIPILTVSAIFLIGLPVTMAQGRGGRNQPVAGQKKGAQRGQPGQQPGGSRDKARKRIHLTEQQRDQLRTCDREADRIREHARIMARDASSRTFEAEQARTQHNQLREMLQTMNQEHERLRQGLSREQHLQLQSRLRVMEQQHERARARLQLMEQELKRARPDRKRVAKRAREIESAMQRWQEQYGYLQREVEGYN